MNGDKNDSNKVAEASRAQEPQLQEGRDYYLEHGLFVFTAAFLLKRGYCCESGCRECPYRDTPARAVDR